MNLELINEFLKDQQLYERAPATMRNYKYLLLRIDGIIKKPFEEMTSTDIKNFISTLNGDKRSSKAVYLQQLNKFTEWLQEEKQISFQHHPIKRVRKEIMAGRAEKTIKEIPSINQMSKLVKLALDPTKRLILMLLYKTGIREGELAGIDIEDVDLEKGRILIKAKTSKTKRDRWAYIDPELKICIEDYLSYRKNLGAKDNALIITQRRTRIAKIHIWKIVNDLGQTAFKKYGDKVYADLHPHLLRHTFTSHLAKNRIMIKALQILRGDEDKSMVDLYTHLTDEEVKLEYLRSVPKIF